MTKATIMNASLNGMEKIQEMKRAVPISIKPVIITIEPMITHWPDAICWFPVWDGIIGLPIVTWTIRACWIWICGFSFWDGISIATSSDGLSPKISSYFASLLFAKILWHCILIMIHSVICFWVFNSKLQAGHSSSLFPMLSPTFIIRERALNRSLFLLVDILSERR